MTASLALLEAGDVAALSSEPGGNLAKIRESAADLVSCAQRKLSVAVGFTGERVDRFDSNCDVTFLTDVASSYNVSLATDPCCNATLRQWSCCQPRGYEYEVSSVVVTPIVATDSSSIGLKCRQTELARYLLSQFDRFYRKSINGLCAAQTEPELETVDENLGWARRCFDRAYRPDMVCHAHSECLSGVCRNQRCVPNVGDASKLMLRCLVSSIAGDIRPLLLIELGLTVSSIDASLENAFQAAVTNTACLQLSDPLDPGADDVRSATSIYGVQSEAECIGSETPSVCEDGGPVSGCSERSVCVMRDASNMLMNGTAGECTGLCSIYPPTEQRGNCEDVWGCDLGPVGSELECKSLGRCSDSAFIPSGGICVLPFQALDGGDSDQCARGQVKAPIGCIAFERLSLSECTWSGGRWVLPALTRAACLAERRCAGKQRRRRRDDHDEPDSVWSWQEGKWSKGKVLSVLERRKAVLLRRRVWLARVDWVKVEALLRSVFTRRVAPNVGSLMRCQVLPALTILKFALCDCSNLKGRPTGPCWDYSEPLVLGIRSVAKGTSGFAQTSVGTVSWFLSSCVDDKLPCTLEFGVLLRPVPSPTQMAPRLGASSGILFEPIYDEQGQHVVGTSLSELLYVGLSEQLRGSVEICIRPQLTEVYGFNCSSSCLPVFGFASSGGSVLTFAADIPVTERDGQYCGSVSRKGFYVASRMAIVSEGFRVVAEGFVMTLCLFFSVVLLI